MDIYRKAYAKINLSLDVLGKRPDGYHEVKMIMQTIGLYDELYFTAFDIKEGEEERIKLSCALSDESGAGYEVIRSSYSEEDKNALSEKEANEEANEEVNEEANEEVNDKINEKVNEEASSSVTITADYKDNLVYKAAKSLLPLIPEGKGVSIRLVKHIPMAAGMAGGSTDCAGALHGINELFKLGLSEKELCEYGVKLGADVPYCVMGGTMLSEGIGEILSRLPLLEGINLVIAKPEEGVSTKYVYETLDALENPEHPDVDTMLDKIKKNDNDISMCLGNILECVTIPVCPKVSKIKDMMMEYGAKGVLMSGSGPTVFGIFESERAAKEAAVKMRDNEDFPAKDIFVTSTV